MSIQQHYAPNLEIPEVYAFLAGDTQPPPVFDAPVVPRAGFIVSSAPKKLVESISQLPQGKPLRLNWAEKEQYVVTEGSNPGQVVGSFDVVVPIEQTVKIHIYSYLSYKDNVPIEVRQRIDAAFNLYQYPRDGDPIDYCAKKLAEDGTVTREMFAVENTFSLEKIGGREPRTEQRDSILSVYKDQGYGEIYPGPGKPAERLNENGYFHKREIHARQVFPNEIVGRVPDANHDSLHQVDGNGRPPEKIIEEIIKREANPLDCNRDCEQIQWKILKLLEYPEFKVVFRDYGYEIGCGVWVVISLPVLQSRTSELNLYAYVRKPNDVGDIVRRVIEACVWRAALSGAVVGVVVGNFVIALQAFRAVFTECLKEKLDQFIECMIPGLTLIASVKPGKDWDDV